MENHLEEDIEEGGIEEDEVDFQEVEDLDILVVVLVDDLQEDQDTSEVEQVAHEALQVHLQETQEGVVMVGKNNNLAFITGIIIIQD